LRRTDGKRTQFAFAYSAKGGQEAAKLASQGLKASIDTLIEQRLAFFSIAPAAPQDTDTLLCRTLAKAFSVMRANVYAPEKPILSRWTTPARWPEQQMHLRDSAFHSLGLAHLDIGLAKEALAAVYGFQDDEGFVPGTMPARATEAISQPPLLAWAAWQMYARDKRRDQAFLERSYEVISKQVVWYMKQRRLGGEPPPEKALEFGMPLYSWKSAAESGQENSPRFAGGADFAAVDLTCYLASECRALQRMAQALRFGEQAKTWDRRAEAIERAARERLWDPERGFFFDRRGADGPWVDTWTSAAFLTLWSGVATKDQADRLVGHLVSGKFQTAMPVASVARDDPAFKKDLWSGAAWPTMNYLIIRGLQRYGYAKEAADLRQRTLEAVGQWYAQTGALWEFYDPDGEAPPAQLDRNGRKTSGIGYAVLGDYNPTAAVFADLVLRPEP
jgi:glycogen debranching enzyme